MKKAICTITSVIILLALNHILMAHGDIDKQSIESTEVALETQTEQKGHLMIEESDIVNAKMSDFPSLHPLIVHFPIVLLIVALLTQIISFFTWSKPSNWMTFAFLIVGFISAYMASTFIHPHTSVLSEAASNVLLLHEKFANYTLWLSGIALGLKGINMLFIKNKQWLNLIVAILLLGAVFTISKAGHYGATLTHIHGVGIQGNYIESHESGHDHKH